MTIDERQEELISQFELVDDWMDRYQMIIDLGDQLEPVDDAEHTNENLIDGCQSRVWIIIAPQEDGTLHLKADSDALITKGIAAMLLYCYNDPVSYTHLCPSSRSTASSPSCVASVTTTR